MSCAGLKKRRRLTWTLVWPVAPALERLVWPTARALEKPFDDRRAIRYRARCGGSDDAAEKEPQHFHDRPRQRLLIAPTASAHVHVSDHHGLKAAERFADVSDGT